MALDDTLLVRAGNMDEAATIVTGSVSIDSGTLHTDVQALINVYKADILADYPPDYAAAQPRLTTLTNDILDAIDATTGGTWASIFAQAKQALIDYETTNGLTNPCPKCQSSSFFTGSDGVKRFCDLSNGYTQTAVAKKVDLDSVNYIDV